MKREIRPGYKKLVISRRGLADIRIVALLRIACALFTGVVLVTVAEAIADGRAARSQWAIAMAAALAAAVCAFAEILYGGVAARREERTIRHRLMTTAFVSAAVPVGQTETDSARLITLHTDNAERVTEYRQVYFGSTLAAMAIPFLTLAYVAMAIDPILGFTIMGICPLIPLLLFVFMRFFRATSARSRKERAVLADKYLDAIRNLVTIRLLGAGPRIEARLREQGERNRGAIMRLLAGNQLVIIIIDGMFSLILICCSAALVIARFHAGAVNLAQAIAVMLLTVLLIEPLVQVAGFFYIGMGGMASERAIGAYLASHGSVRRPDIVATESLDEDLDAAISVHGLVFDYGRGPVLNGVELLVEPGSKVAIVGRSGVGKTTLMGLLRGSLPIQKGSIAIGGRDLAELEPFEIRRLTASVSQNTWLFTGTIADNLRIAKSDATDREMWAALELAQVADEVTDIGLHATIGEQGALISGGQAQRISLARALLSGRRILLLDEPTSQVDIESEERIIDAIATLGREWTLLIVTHRKSLLDIADQTLTLNEGILVSQNVTGKSKFSSQRSNGNETFEVGSVHFEMSGRTTRRKRFCGPVREGGSKRQPAEAPGVGAGSKIAPWEPEDAPGEAEVEK